MDGVNVYFNPTAGEVEITVGTNIISINPAVIPIIIEKLSVLGESLSQIQELAR